MRLKQLSFEEFVAAGISSAVARFLTAGEHPIPRFHILMRPVNSRWDYYIPADASNVIGLWDVNADPVCRWQRNGVVEFVWLFHDSDDVEVVATSEQALLGKLFLDYHEMESDPSTDPDEMDRKMRRFGSYIGFEGTEPLLRLLNEYPGDEKFDQEYAALLASL